MEQSPASSSKEPFTSTSSTAPAQSPWKNESILLKPFSPTQSQGQKKRKGSSPSSAVSLKKTKTIIDCQKAIAFFSELGLDKSFVNCGKVLAWNLEPLDPDYLKIQTYVFNGKPFFFKCQVLQVLRVMAHANSLREEGTLSSFNDDPSTKGQLRKMLWHGTSVKNVAKILQNGLKLPKKMSQWFGDGIYFSDLFGMSVGYCKDWRNGHLSWELDKEGNKVAYLFLSDVLLGNVHKVYDLEPTAPKISVSKPGGWFWQREIKKVDSIQGCGRWIMDPQGDEEIDGCVWPLGGKMLDKNKPWFAAPFFANEFVVYETRRVITKFLVKVKIEYDFF